MEESVYQILTSLRSLLEPALGPNGLDVMIQADGHIISTNYGIQLIQLSLSHPIKQLLSNTVSSFHRMTGSIKTGDGAKRFIIIIAAALHELQFNIPREHLHIRVSYHFSQLQALLINDIVPQLHREYVQCGQLDRIRNVVEHVLNTCLMPHHNLTVRKTLTRLIISGLFDAGTHYFKTLRNTIDCFESLITLTSGGCVTNSLVVKGFILDNNEWIGDIEGLSAPIITIILKCGLELDNEGHMEAKIRVTDTSDVTQLLKYWEYYMKTLLEHVKLNGVHVLLVQGSVPRVMNTLIRSLGLCVIPNISSETLSDIEKLAGILGLSKLQEMLSLSQFNLLYLSKICEVSSGVHSKYINIQYLSNGDSRLVRPTSFILSAPTLGVARQLKMALKNCLITLSKLFSEGCDNIAIVHGGGAWEIELIRILHQHKALLPRSSPMWMCLKSLEEGLLAVPQILLRIKKSPHQRGYASLHQGVYKTTKRLTVNAIEGHLTNIESFVSVVEPFNVIPVLVCGICQTLSQLCRIGTIHYVNRKLVTMLPENDDEND